MSHIRYVTADYRSPWAQIRVDLARAPWRENSFDVIFCSHVLEHIVDDRAAIAELHRLLRPGGWGLVLVPFQMDRETLEDPSIVAPEARLSAYGQEDHVRVYGRDYLERLRAAGLNVEYGRYARKLGAAAAQYHGLQPDEYLIVIRKPEAPVTTVGECEPLWDPASDRDS